MGRGFVLGGQPCPHHQMDGVTALTRFWDSFLFLRTLFVKFDVVTHVMYVRGSWGQPRLPSQESGVLGLSNFGEFPVFMPTSFNAERPHSAW